MHGPLLFFRMAGLERPGLCLVQSVYETGFSCSSGGMCFEQETYRIRKYNVYR